MPHSLMPQPYFSSSQPQSVAEHPKQGRIRIDIYRVGLTVDSQSNHISGLPFIIVIISSVNPRRGIRSHNQVGFMIGSKAHVLWPAEHPIRIFVTPRGTPYMPPNKCDKKCALLFFSGTYQLQPSERASPYNWLQIHKQLRAVPDLQLSYTTLCSCKAIQG